MPIKKYESVDLKHCNESKAFIDYSNHVIDIFENIYEYNSKKKKKKKKIAKYILHLMIWLLIYLITKQLQPIITELFTRSKKKKKKKKKMNIALAQSYFAVQKNIRLNSTLL